MSVRQHYCFLGKRSEALYLGCAHICEIDRIVIRREICEVVCGNRDLARQTVSDDGALVSSPPGRVWTTLVSARVAMRLLGIQWAVCCAAALGLCWVAKDSLFNEAILQKSVVTTQVRERYEMVSMPSSENVR